MHKVCRGALLIPDSLSPLPRFGRGIYTAPTFEIATGKMECDVCKKMLLNSRPSVQASHSSFTLLGGICVKTFCGRECINLLFVWTGCKHDVYYGVVV